MPQNIQNHPLLIYLCCTFGNDVIGQRGGNAGQFLKASAEP